MTDHARTRRHPRFRVAAAVSGAVLVALVGLAWLSLGPRQGGRTVSDWLQRLSSGAVAERQEAREALVAMGAEALPGLESVLRERPGSLRVRLREAWDQWRLGPDGVMPREVRQGRAALATFFLADEAGVDISRLVPLLRFHLTNGIGADMQFGRALTRAGPEGIDCLVQLLGNGDPRGRDLAGWALSSDAPTRGRPGVSDAMIAAAGGETDPMMRSRLLLYLSLFGSDTDAARVVPLGLQGLGHTNALLRRASVELLGAHRRDPRVRPALVSAADDPEIGVRTAARRFLDAP